MDVFDETGAMFVVPIHGSPVWFPVNEFEGFVGPEVIFTKFGLENWSSSGLPEDSFVLVGECSLEQMDLGSAGWKEEHLLVGMVGVVVNVLFRQSIGIYIELRSEGQFMVWCFFVLVSFDVLWVRPPSGVQAFH